jgi:tetratricopeptide (TPR) repeat protein
MLEVLLSERFPARKFEVINVSVVAINSHAILPIAQECASKEADLWLVYMGNNEMSGPYGVHGLFDLKAPPCLLVKASLALKRLRIVQLLDAALRCRRTGSVELTRWRGMQMWQRSTPRSDPSVKRVLHNFKANLQGILRAGRRAAVPVIVCTMPCNLKDCSPFSSVHQAGLGSEQKSQWGDFFNLGLKQQGNDRVEEALDSYLGAARIDPHFAELQFRLGQCYAALDRNAEALQHFRLAKDEDALQFRPDSRLNDIIRLVMSEQPHDGAHLLDAEKLFEESSSHGIPGGELFYEHVHLTPAGNYVLAKGAAQEIADLILKPTGASVSTPSPKWLTETECFIRLGLTDWGLLRALETISRLLQDPPFTNQSVHTNQMEKVSSELKRLRPADHPSGVRRALQIVQQAVQRRPDDADLLSVLAAIQEAAVDVSGAEKTWRQVVALRPFASIPYLELAQLLSLQGKTNEAEPMFRQCLLHDPFNDQALGDLGKLLLEQNRPRDAIANLRTLVKLEPESVSGHSLLGQALLEVGDKMGAMRELSCALKLDPSSVSANELGKQLLKSTRSKNDKPKLQ